MKTSTGNPDAQQNSRAPFRAILAPALVGAAVFWVVSFVTSLLPLAADYRSAYSSWSAQTVWLGAIFAGLFFGWLVSYFNIRRAAKKPAGNTILRAVFVSMLALAAAILLIDVPLTFQAKQNVLHYFWIGVMFNTVRFLLLGLTVGLVCRRMERARKTGEIWGT